MDERFLVFELIFFVFVLFLSRFICSLVVDLSFIARAGISFEIRGLSVTGLR